MFAEEFRDTPKFVPPSEARWLQCRNLRLQKAYFVEANCLGLRDVRHSLLHAESYSSACNRQCNWKFHNITFKCYALYVTEQSNFSPCPPYWICPRSETKCSSADYIPYTPDSSWFRHQMVLKPWGFFPSSPYAFLCPLYSQEYCIKSLPKKLLAPKMHLCAEVSFQYIWNALCTYFQTFQWCFYLSVGSVFHMTVLLFNSCFYLWLGGNTFSKISFVYHNYSNWNLCIDDIKCMWECGWLTDWLTNLCKVLGTVHRTETNDKIYSLS